VRFASGCAQIGVLAGSPIQSTALRPRSGLRSTRRDATRRSRWTRRRRSSAPPRRALASAWLGHAAQGRRSKSSAWQGQGCGSRPRAGRGSQRWWRCGAKSRPPRASDCSAGNDKGRMPARWLARHHPASRSGAATAWRSISGRAVMRLCPRFSARASGFGPTCRRGPPRRRSRARPRFRSRSSIRRPRRTPRRRRRRG
jgi:hypothetical protein